MQEKTDLGRVFPIPTTYTYIMYKIRYAIAHIFGTYKNKLRQYTETGPNNSLRNTFILKERQITWYNGIFLKY